MDNKKANDIIEITSNIREMVGNGEIKDYSFHFDEKTNTLNIKATPVEKVQYINIEFTITPTGVKFK